MTTLHLGETVTLTGPFPPIPPLVANARVAADVLFIDPPSAYAINVTEYDVTVQGLASDGIDEWAARHYLTLDESREEDDGNTYRVYVGVIEGVPFRAVSVTR